MDNILKTVGNKMVYALIYAVAQSLTTHLLTIIMKPEYQIIIWLISCFIFVLALIFWYLFQQINTLKEQLNRNYNPRQITPEELEQNIYHFLQTAYPKLDDTTPVLQRQHEDIKKVIVLLAKHTYQLYEFRDVLEYLADTSKGGKSRVDKTQIDRLIIEIRTLAEKYSLEKEFFFRHR